MQANCPGTYVAHQFGLRATVVLVWCWFAWIPSSCSSVEMIEDDYTNYYDSLFLIEPGDNTSVSRALNWIISVSTDRSTISGSIHHPHNAPDSIKIESWRYTLRLSVPFIAFQCGLTVFCHSALQEVFVIAWLRASLSKFFYTVKNWCAVIYFPRCCHHYAAVALWSGKDFVGIQGCHVSGRRFFYWKWCIGYCFQRFVTKQSAQS